LIPPLAQGIVAGRTRRHSPDSGELEESHMRNARLALFGAMALSIVAIGAPAAQQRDDRNDNRRKPPKQTHDKGVDSPEPAAQSTIGERIAANAVVTVRADGSTIAFLDESFHDALVATKGADGNVTYLCVHGLPAGAKHVAEPGVAPRTPVLEEK
jgi:hypothetical protein